MDTCFALLPLAEVLRTGKEDARRPASLVGEKLLPAMALQVRAGMIRRMPFAFAKHVGYQMAVDSPTLDLPLHHATPPAWAARVLQDPLTLLNDHAWLEKKAASNALELLNRWPDPRPPENWVAAMTAIARDEVEHLATVVRILARRGGRLSKRHSNAYASQLRQHVRVGSPEHVIDRLLISALIEARSCERFYLLGVHCEDPELKELYRGLYASENGHYRSFLGLAEQLPDVEEVQQRWEELLAIESEVIRAQPCVALMHSGWEAAASDATAGAAR